MSTGDDAVNLVAEFTAKKGSEAALVEALTAVIAPSLEEEGCQRFELNQSRDDARVVTAIERFSDQAAFDAHVSTPYIKDLLENRVPELVETQHIVFYRQIGI